MPKLAILRWKCLYHSVPQTRSPFCNLSLSTKRRGAYTWDVTISLTITPSLPVKHDLIIGGGWGPSARQRDAPDVTGRLTSSVFAVDTLMVDSHVFNILTAGWVFFWKGAYVQNKNTSARLCAKNTVGGGGVFAGHYGICRVWAYAKSLLTWVMVKSIDTLATTQTSSCLAAQVSFIKAKGGIVLL